ncbi:MAG: porin [Planctomycetota bacterium]|nr:porin [Planctomycetota bacterium]
MKILRFVWLAALLAAVFVGPSLGRAQYRASVDNVSPGLPNQTLALADGDGAAATAPQASAGVLTDEAIKRIVDQRLAEIKQEEEQRKKEAAEKGYEVGTDLSLKASLKDGLFPWLETPNKDFTMHLGCWFQWDNVWWNQSPGLKAARGANAGPTQGVASGNALGGIGDLQDGVYFRRIRPNVEGTFWETGEYRFIPAFENNQFNTAGIDEMWVGAKGLPFIGTLRVGHVKNAMGLEADMTASSRCMTFMERSNYSEAIELNQNFVTGLWLSNTYAEERGTWTFVTFRPDQGSSTDAFFGDGQWGLQGRLTGLPLYEDDGRHLMHLGISSGFRNGTTNLAISPTHTVQMRARPEMRDDVPGGGLINSDANRMIDTGVMASDAQYLLGLEALYIRGPMSLQAEYGWTWIESVTGIFNPYTNPGAAFTPFATSQNYMFNGGYVQLAYTLTGENRSYDKRMGTLGRAYLGSHGPFSNAWAVQDENGCVNWSWGAWEIAARYSFANLNNGSGTNRIQGGIEDGFGLALNWYLNNNLTVNFDWIYDHRYGLPTDSVPGETNGFGSRVQFQF